jgi:hypothetical protein
MWHDKTNRKLNIVRFEVLTSVGVTITLFWDVTPCSLYQSIGGTCCFLLHSLKIAL